MRVVHYHPRAALGDGGITNSVRRLSGALAAQGQQAVVAHDRGAAPIATDGVEWVDVPHAGPEGFRVPRTLGAALDGADLLVLNSGWTASNVVAGAAARRHGVPYVLAPRGAYDPQLLGRRRVAKRLWWSAFERNLVAQARALHVFFESQTGHLTALGYPGPFLVAPNGVSVPGDRAWDGGSGGYLLYLGRFDPEHKGLDLLVRAVGQLPVPQRPALRMHGPDWRGGKARTAALVEELGLGRWVTLGPPVYGDEKWELLTHARGFVYPSRWEGFGNSLAEAAALGVPSLATPYPLAVRLADRGAAMVAEPNPPALADGLRMLSSDAARTLGARAAALVTEELTWEAVARRWVEQARTLIQHNDTRA